MTCKIFGAGDVCTKERISPRSQDDLIIAADGGYQWLADMGWKPDVVLGDFDSLPAGPPKEAVCYPRQKDDTDMGLAVEEGLRRGCRKFELYGGTGGRADHTMANYQLLTKLAKQGAQGYLIDSRMTATVLSDGEIRFRAKPSGLLSVFSLDEVSEGVTISGLYYPLTEKTLTNSYALGVSNEFQGSEAAVRVRKGTLLIIGEYLPEDVKKR